MQRERNVRDSHRAGTVLASAIKSLDDMAEQKRATFGECSDYDRLRGKRMGVELALDYARGLRR